MTTTAKVGDGRSCATPDVKNSGASLGEHVDKPRIDTEVCAVRYMLPHFLPHIGRNRVQDSWQQSFTRGGRSAAARV